MKLLNNNLLVLGLLIMMILLVSAPVLGATVVKIQSPPVAASLPLLWMEKEGKLADFVDLDITLSSDHQRARALIAKNEIDIMVTGVNVGAQAYNKNIGIKLMNVNTWAIDYLLTDGFKADKWSELKGKKLSLPLKGGPLDFLARYFLKENGVSPEEVNFVYRPLPNGARYFMAGKVDAILLPEPLVTVSLAKNKKAKLSLDLQKEWGKLHDGDQRIPYVGLFVSEKFANENPETVKMLNGMYMQGIEWVNNNPEQAARMGSEHFGLPAGVLKASFKRVRLDYFSKNKSRELVERYFSEIMEMYPEMLGDRIPDDGFYF